jgi:ATP-dependent Lhr-like helicase
LARIGPPAGAGRWSLVAPLIEPVPSATESAHATALQLVERHGVVTREAVLAEGVVGGYSAVYGVLKVLEERGQVRRGYFVSGLGAAQFALPGAVDRLRQARQRADDAGSGAVAAPVVLAATDPAQPFGAALPWPDTAGHPARTGAAVVVLRDGVPLAWYDRRSFHLVTFPATLHDRSWAEALADQVRAGRLRKVELRKIDGDAVTASPVAGEIAAAAKAAGFTDGYRGLVFQSR